MKTSIEGGLAPYLDVELDRGESLLAESGALLCKSPSVELRAGLLGGVSGAVKRVLGGGSLFVVELQGPGQVSLTHGRPGRIVPITLDGRRQVHVASRAFLCCERGVSLDVAVATSSAAWFWAQLPFLMLRFSGTGQAFAVSHGDVKEVALGRGESLDVAPGRIVTLDEGVRVEKSARPGLLTSMLAGSGLSLVTLTGPGAVCLQTRDEEATRTVVRERSAGPGPVPPGRPPRVPRPPRPPADDDVIERWIGDDHRSD